MKIPRNCEGGDCLFTVIGRYDFTSRVNIFFRLTLCRSECSVSMGARSAEQCRNFVIGLKLITGTVLHKDNLHMELPFLI